MCSIAQTIVPFNNTSEEGGGGETTPNEQGRMGSLYSISQIQELLGIGRTKAYEIAAHELPVVRIGRTIRVREEDVRAFVARNQTEQNRGER